jgi:hypothetical protein
MNPYAPQNPYAPPQAPVMPAGYAGGSVARMEGELLVVTNGAQFPPVCLRCGATQPIEWRDQRFTYIPPWARFFGVLIQAIVTKRSRFNLPLCSPCNAQWKKFNLILGLSWIPGALFFVLAGVLAGADVVEEDVTAILFLVGLVVFLGGLITAAVLRARKVVQATKIDKESTWMKGIALGAREAILGQQQQYQQYQQQPYQWQGQGAPGYGPR